MSENKNRKALTITVGTATTFAATYRAAEKAAGRLAAEALPGELVCIRRTGEPGASVYGRVEAFGWSVI